MPISPNMVLLSPSRNYVRQSMTYEWDEAKSRANLAKHRVDFTEIEFFDWDTAVYSVSDRYGESRTSATGYISNILHFVIYTVRGENFRIMSLHVASREERETYGRLRRL